MIEVIILTRDRKEFLEELVEILIKLNDSRIKIIISDNSECEHNYNFIGKNVEIRKRFNLDPDIHFNTVISEVNHEYFTLFHDDDLIMPNYFDYFFDFHSKDKSWDLLFNNAYIINNKKEKICKFNYSKNDFYTKGSYDFLAQFFCLNKSGSFPFPAIIYRSSNYIKFDSKICGKYMDIVALTSAANYLLYKFNCEPHYLYRVHGENDSSSKDFKNIKRLYNFIKKNNFKAGFDFYIRNLLKHNKNKYYLYILIAPYLFYSLLSNEFRIRTIEKIKRVVIKKQEF